MLSTKAGSYTARQVKAVLREVGVIIEGETHNDYQCLCPYHPNRDTPAMAVSKTKGTFLCFSPSCGRKGTLTMLVADMTRKNEFEVRRLIYKHGQMSAEEFDAELESLLEPVEFKEYNKHDLETLEQNLWNPATPEGLEYMHGRKFQDETLKHFKIGYSHKQRSVTIPLRSPDGKWLGFIGRGIDSKEFKNTWQLPKNETLFNIHSARANETAYVTEASFDAMRLWQAGFPGAVAVLGGNISDRQIHLLNMYFTRIVIFTDFDAKKRHPNPDRCPTCMPRTCRGHNAGRDLGQHIAKRLQNKEILWGTYDYGMVYPDGAKDVSDMTDEQIKQCVKNATPNYVYQTLDLY